MLKNLLYKFNLNFMKERSFQEWVNFFVTLNLSLFAVLMFFVPAYPWWVFTILALVSAYVAPRFLKNLKSGKSKTRNRF